MTHIITPTGVTLPLKQVLGKPLRIEAFGHQRAEAGWPLGFVLCQAAEGQRTPHQPAGSYPTDPIFHHCCPVSPLVGASAFFPVDDTLVHLGLVASVWRLLTLLPVWWKEEKKWKHFPSTY